MSKQSGEGRLIVLAGGGTGGHLTPGLAVAEVLRAREVVHRVQLFGTGRPVETVFFSESRPDADIEIERVALPAEPLSQLRRRPLRFVWNNARATWHTLRRFRRDRPTAVIGLGGFASASVIVAARRLGVPIVLLEQNLVPGKVTRWFCRVAHLVCLSFDETRALLPSGVRTVATGNPVRASVQRAGGQRKRAVSAPRGTLIVLGGSQGATALNAAVPRALQAVKDRVPELRVVHQTGSGQWDAVRRAYVEADIPAVVRPFFADLPDWMARSDLAVSRAGATTLAELACLGIPAVLVPYPHAADDHQLHNARLFQRRGAAAVVCQSAGESWVGALAEKLSRLLSSAQQRHQMGRAMAGLARPEAAERVAQQLEFLIGHAPHTDFPRVPHRPLVVPETAVSASSPARRAD